MSSQDAPKQWRARWPFGTCQTVSVAVLISGSGALWGWALTAHFPACAQPPTPDEWLVRTAATLDATVDLGIKIAITLVGAGGALLVGLRSTTAPLTTPAKLLLLSAIIAFAQAALAGGFWKFRLATAWLNKCLEHLASSWMDNFFDVSIYFFGAGLISMLAWVVVSAFTIKE
jgi:hypothetical protein